MELKLFISILVGMAISILIVSLWNWNMVDVFIVQNGFSSNCTFMELKFGKQNREDIIVLVF